MERRSKKISIAIFLFAIFMLFAVVTGGWLYKMYAEQTGFSEKTTMATVICGKYYFAIDADSVSYENGTLYFEIENTYGAEIPSIVVDGGDDVREVALDHFSQGMIQPVSVPINFFESVTVYPSGCGGLNFKTLTFEPNTTA